MISGLINDAADESLLVVTGLINAAAYSVELTWSFVANIRGPSVDWTEDTFCLLDDRKISFVDIGIFVVDIDDVINDSLLVVFLLIGDGDDKVIVIMPGGV